MAEARVVPYAMDGRARRDCGQRPALVPVAAEGAAVDLLEEMSLGWEDRERHYMQLQDRGGRRQRLAQGISNQLDEGWTGKLARGEHRGRRELVSWDEICTPSRGCSWTPSRCSIGTAWFLGDATLGKTLCRLLLSDGWEGRRQVAKSRRTGWRGRRGSSRVRDVHPSPSSCRELHHPHGIVSHEPTSVSADYVVQGFGSIMGRSIWRAVAVDDTDTGTASTSSSDKYAAKNIGYSVP
ncbi:hypothetical protein M440DRAFT_143460 [Trichoderma longibrachiatum ATCC 18648]|uniref:Uncharacterized protein n=1 Tax=Trichoderma longibrachiatum ATCC 18648 TaxID=983965 RepID=A0A2T4BV20_TRILO|nr:hypothetical protein M440DRAFT_143460 [Trichoderma longibrachiatum ATCC 18648]